MRPNYEIKAKYLVTDLPKYQRKISKYQFYKTDLINTIIAEEREPTEEEKCKLNTWEEREHFWNEKMLVEYGMTFADNQDSWQECLKINRAYYQRVKRLRNKVAKMLENPCVFLTFTWRNSESYFNTSIETKRKYVQRALNGLKCHYVANIDYGKKKERVHFHALVECESVSQDIWEYGNLDHESCYNKNDAAICKYINKLTNHAIKETCKGNRCLYDRLN